MCKLVAISTAPFLLLVATCLDSPFHFLDFCEFFVSFFAWLLPVTFRLTVQGSVIIIQFKVVSHRNSCPSAAYLSRLLLSMFHAFLNFFACGVLCMALLANSFMSFCNICIIFPGGNLDCVILNGLVYFSLSLTFSIRKIVGLFDTHSFVSSASRQVALVVLFSSLLSSSNFSVLPLFCCS